MPGSLETLAAIKNPQPVAFVRQANIGQAVQVNNAAHPNTSRAREPEKLKTELLEHTDGERLDTRTAFTASGADPALATVGALHRPAHHEG